MKKIKLRILIPVFAMVIAIVLVAALQIQAKLNKIQYDKDSDKKIELNEELLQNESMTGYTTIALFGLDSREDNLDHANSDTIILANIDHDNKKIDFLSVYRDTLLDTGDNSYRKCNAAYQKGGASQAVSMLNQNLDLNIENYIAVDFEAVMELVDALDGVSLDLTAEELKVMPIYCDELSKLTGKKYAPLPSAAGTYTLDGIQALSYARVRYTKGDDLKRTERQRVLIKALMEKIKNCDYNEILDLLDIVLPHVKTNFSKKELLTTGLPLLSYSYGDSTGFPFEFEGKTLGKKGACLIPTTLESNVKELHKVLYQDENYSVSEDGLEKSDNISDMNQ